MFEFANVPVSVTILGGMTVVFISFTCLLMAYLRFYFNRYEPVYIMLENGSKVKNPIASRFCKIIISNTITNQCLNDSDNVGLWLLVCNVINAWPRDDILNIADLHKEVLHDLSMQLDETKYEKMAANLINLELALNSNLLKSKIRTPPYVYTNIYALWISRVLSTLNKT